jgi:hypothetical protein
MRQLIVLVDRDARLHSSAATSPGGLSVGATVPAFSAQTAGGGTFTVVDLEGLRTIVLFVSGHCQPCEVFIDDMRRGTNPDLKARLLVAVDAWEEESVGPLHGATVIVQQDHAISAAFDSRATPHAFVLDEERRVIASGLPNDWAALRQLLSSSDGGVDARDLETLASAK